MASDKISLLLAGLVLFTGFAAALDFSVEIRPTAEASVYQVENLNSSDFNTSMALENTGSVGCEFRLKGVFNQGSQEVVRYSRPYPIWPGEGTDVELAYIPVNYTGEVKSEISLEYCWQERHLENFSFESNERIVPNKTIDSKTLEFNNTNAVVSFKDVEKAHLIPQEYPPYWKVGAADLKDGVANLNYRAPLFKKGENITYTVVQNRSVIGKTKVQLEDQETWFEELLRNISSVF